MTKYHTIFIGGGINNLVCAALLAKKGHAVLVIERTEYLGGCIRSEHIDGCIIDTLSTAYPLFVTSPAYAELATDLAENGIKFINNDTPTATILSNKKFSILKTNATENELNFDKLEDKEGLRYREQINWVGENAEVLFSILGQEPISLSVAKTLGKFVWKKGIQESVKTIGNYLTNIRNDYPNHFKSQELQALLAPWVLHTGLSPESTFSSTMTKIIAFTLEQVGLPQVEGGSYKIVEAFENIITSKGGICITQQNVEEILIDDHKTVTGIKTSNGDIYNASNVVASVTPTQLYGSLLDSKNVPEKVTKEASNFKYGMGNMQIHLILNEKPKWFDKALTPVTYVHLSDGIDAISKAVNAAKRQTLPANPTICIAQPSENDPTRATDGKSVLWIQLPECPNFPIADGANKLNELTKGEWTEELKQAYADKIIKEIGKYISNIESACIYKSIISPKELGQLNVNLVNGDPYSGLCDIGQYLAWRPLKALKNHDTPIKNLYHSGASTHPGPGLGGGAGYLIAQQLLNK